MTHRVATPSVYKDVQVRTWDYTYRFQAKLQVGDLPSSIWTKIYNTERTLVYAKEYSALSRDIQDVFSAKTGRELIARAVARGLMFEAPVASPWENDTTQISQEGPLSALWEVERVCDDSAGDDPFLSHIRALDRDPYQLDRYEIVASLLEDTLEKSHILLMGACHAIECGKSEVAARLCRLAAEVNEDFFLDRLVDVALWRHKVSHPEAVGFSHLQEKLLSLAQGYERHHRFEEMVKVYKMLSHGEYSPVYYEKLIYGYKALGQEDQAFSWALSEVALLMENKQWPQAESVAQHVLEQWGPRVGVYERLEIIYAQWNPSQLGNLWSQLGRAYCDQQQWDLAERVYQRAFDREGKPDQARELAEIQTLRQHTPASAGAFGAAQWSRYIGDVGIEPPLPAAIEAICHASCPFWPGKQVKDTHMLVLIPQTVNAEPFTFNAFTNLVKQPRGGGYSAPIDERNSWRRALHEQGSHPAAASHWVLMPKQPLPRGANQTYAQQCAFVQTIGFSYEVASFLDAVTCMVLERVRTGSFLYAAHPQWVRVQEQSGGHRLMLGAFSTSGLQVLTMPDNISSDQCGVALLKKV